MKRYVVFDMIGVIFKSEMMTEVLYRLVPHKATKKKLKELYHRFEVGEISGSAFWEGLRIKDHKKIEKEFLDKTVFDEDVFAITKLLKKKYRLGILSNMPEAWGRYFVRKYGLGGMFDEIIFSGGVKAKKPDKEMYDIAIKRFGKFCFIDDRIENLKAAKRFGIRTILMERSKKRKFEPDYRIHSLPELKDILL